MIKRYKRTNFGWMRRSSRVYLANLNNSKILRIKSFIDNYNRVLAKERVIND